uniref:KRAB domain-containing protein n=1 Tax=Pelusios castaneus TaxID=367368 RepID=A0A8C8S645_9SAUR
MLQNFSALKWAGFKKVSKPDVLSHLKPKEDPWVSNPQDSQEKKILKGTCPGEESVGMPLLSMPEGNNWDFLLEPGELFKFRTVSQQVETKLIPFSLSPMGKGLEDFIS